LYLGMRGGVTVVEVKNIKAFVEVWIIPGLDFT
jgi:hypothetical protein